MRASGRSEGGGEPGDACQSDWGPALACPTRRHPFVIKTVGAATGGGVGRPLKRPQCDGFARDDRVEDGLARLPCFCIREDRCEPAVWQRVQTEPSCSEQAPTNRGPQNGPLGLVMKTDICVVGKCLVGLLLLSSFMGCASDGTAGGTALTTGGEAANGAATASERADLTFIREEEKLAHDVYVSLNA